MAGLNITGKRRYFQMKNRKPTNKQMKNERCEHHSNLALITTVVAMISFVVLMIVYMGDHNPSRIEMAFTASRVCSVGYWVAAAILAVKSVKTGAKHLLEYIIYMIIVGFGLMFMYNMPHFAYELLEGTRLGMNWARAIFKGLSLLSVVYFLTSVIWHLVLATPKRGK